MKLPGVIEKVPKKDARRYVAAFLHELHNLAKSATWHDEIARYDLIQAEIERKSGNLAMCRGLLEKATQWIVQSGSQEHLCLLHLAKARLAVDETQFDQAGSIIQEGLHIAEQCGFGLYHIELLIEQTKLYIAANKINDAVKSASSALNGILKSTREAALKPDMEESDLLFLGSEHPKCRFVWGSARAGYLYGQSLLLSGEVSKARKQLEDTLSLQNRIKDPQAFETEYLLGTIE